MGKFSGEEAVSVAAELRFECTGCGACCRRRGSYAFVYLNDGEVDLLAEFLQISRRSFLRRHTVVDEMGWRQLRFSNDSCPFLDEDSGRCGAYAARPAQCRTFPFWRDFVATDGWTGEVRELCEGIGRGPRWSLELVQAAIQEMEAWEKQ